MIFLFHADILLNYSFVRSHHLAFEFSVLIVSEAKT